jgi:hypothetical protein
VSGCDLRRRLVSDRRKGQELRLTRGTGKTHLISLRGTSSFGNEMMARIGRQRFCRQLAARVKPATSRNRTSCGQPVLVVRPLAIVEDRVLLAQVSAIWL